MIIECVEPSEPAVIKPPGGIASPSRSVSELPLRCQSPCLSQTIPLGSRLVDTLSATTMVANPPNRTIIPVPTANNRLLRFMLELTYLGSLRDRASRTGTHRVWACQALLI